MPTLNFSLEVPNIVQEIVTAIKMGQRFLMVPHKFIDGDDLGCMIGLALALRQLDKEVYLYSEDNIPERFLFLEGHELVTNVPPSGQFDAVFILECPEISRLPEAVQKPKHFTDTLITLDHHEDSPGCQRLIGNINWVDAQMSALGEMIALIIYELGLEITPAIATAIYTSIVTDSYAFRYHGVSARTHLIASKLIEFVDTDTVHFEAIIKRTEAEEKLSKLVKATRCVSEDKLIGWATLTKEMLKECQLREEDTQMLLPDINNLGNEVFALFKATDGKSIRVSLRSKHTPVVKVAHQHGGGGHALAASMRLHTQNMEEVQKSVLIELRELLNAQHSEC